MSWQPSPSPYEAPVQARRGGRTIIVGIVLLVLSLIVGGLAGGKIVKIVGKPLREALTNPVHATPADFTMQLQGNRYTVFLQDPTVAYSKVVRVTGPDGGRVPVSESDSYNESITRGDADYRSIARFTPPAPGVYRIRIAVDGSRAFVAPSLGTNFSKVGGWAAAAGLSGLAFLVGLVLLIVGLVRRNSKPKPALPMGQYQGQYQGQQAVQQPAQQLNPQPLPPAGWYPDQEAPGRSRFWDGRSWTDQRR